ncbi:hypothetical protein [Azospirillum sp. sgz302134]
MSAEFDFGGWFALLPFDRPTAARELGMHKSNIDRMLLAADHPRHLRPTAKTVEKCRAIARRQIDLLQPFA